MCYALRSRGNLQLILRAGSAVGTVKQAVGYRTGGSSCSAFFYSGNRDIEMKKVEPVVGLAVQVGLYGQFGRTVGYGLGLHGNVNGEQQFAGTTVRLMLGKLR